MNKSEFVLQFWDGRYHAMRPSQMGHELISVEDVERARKFDSYGSAVSFKNNESHLRHWPMKVVELQYEITVLDRGEVPVQDPQWDNFDRSYDEYCFRSARETLERKRLQLEASEALSETDAKLKTGDKFSEFTS